MNDIFHQFSFLLNLFLDFLPSLPNKVKFQAIECALINQDIQWFTLLSLNNSSLF